MINTWTDAAGTGAVIAIDPATGEQRWKYEMTDVTSSGVLTTATDVLFTGGREGFFHALDARDGTLLWKSTLGGMVANGPISYAVDGEQFVVDRRRRQRPVRVRAAGVGESRPSTAGCRRLLACASERLRGMFERSRSHARSRR